MAFFGGVGSVKRGRHIGRVTVGEWRERRKDSEGVPFNLKFVPVHHFRACRT